MSNVEYETDYGKRILSQHDKGYERPDGIWDFTRRGSNPDLFEKRLTIPELAAEHWLLYCWLWERERVDHGEDHPGIKRIKEFAETFYRFATNPHYDDEENQ